MPSFSFKHLFSALGVIMSVFCIQAADADPIHDVILEEMNNRHILGLQLAVVHNGKLVKQESFGRIDVDNKVPVTNDTLFPINSMTKAFTGTLIVQLVAEGKLALSDPIGKHLANLPSEWQPVTLHQLLSHTSGLPDILTGNGVELVGDGTDTGAWKAVQALPMRSKPGETFSYKQTNYVILGKVIERYSGLRFADAVTELLQKSGMPNSANAGFQPKEPNAVSPQFFYANNRFQPFDAGFSELVWPAAGLSANAGELAQFVMALQNNSVMDTRHLNVLWTPYVLNNGSTAGFNELENGYGAGWQVINRAMHSAVSASGGNAVTLIVYPDDDLTIIVLTNVLGALPIQFVDRIAEYYF